MNNNLPSPLPRKLIEDACRAQEMFDADELEAHAAKLAQSGKTPQIAVGHNDDLAELIED